MFRMHRNFQCRSAPAFMATLCLVVVIFGTSASISAGASEDVITAGAHAAGDDPRLAGEPPAAGGWTLRQLETIALRADPAILSVEANREALGELAIAAEQLPDPMLKMGLVSVPVDSFELGQEPMTQVQLGVVQKFPRGQTRELRGEQIRLQAAGLQERANDQALQIVLAVREQFLAVVLQQRLAEINRQTVAAFVDLVDITRDYYGTGRVHQQDVLQASVELTRARDRSSQFEQAGAEARARLAAWVGEAAFEPLQTDWPLLPEPMPLEQLKEQLRRHPRVSALNKNVAVADTGVELARQSYKPEFSLDLTYGGRGGNNADGRSRPDFLSLMVLMDVPLFHDQRQDRVLAARTAESAAAVFGLDDVYRRLRSEAELNYATLRTQQERLDLFQNTLLPEAAFNTSASLQAYQSSVHDLTAMLRAQLTETDLQLEHARLQAGTRISQARLLYLEGEQP